MKSNFYISTVYKTCANVPRKPSTDDLSLAAYILYSTIGVTAANDLVVHNKSAEIQKVILSESEIDACMYGINKFLGKDTENFIKQLENKIAT